MSYSNNALLLALIISLLRSPISDTFGNAIARLTTTKLTCTKVWLS